MLVERYVKRDAILCVLIDQTKRSMICFQAKLLTDLTWKLISMKVWILKRQWNYICVCFETDWLNKTEIVIISREFSNWSQIIIKCEWFIHVNRKIENISLKRSLSLWTAWNFIWCCLKGLLRGLGINAKIQHGLLFNHRYGDSHGFCRGRGCKTTCTRPSQRR